MQWAFLLLLPGLSLAQAQPSGPSPWNVGLKLGTGASYSGFSAGSAHPWTAYTGGLTGGYRFGVPGGVLTLQADALLERRAPWPWQLPSATNAVLFVPVYLRTSRPAARVHLLAGGGPSFWLAGNAVPDALATVYTTYPVEATGLAGLEVRLLPLGRYETTLALTYRAGFTPELVHNRQSASLGLHYTDRDTHSWLGATLNLYVHSPVRP